MIWCVDDDAAIEILRFADALFDGTTKRVDLPMAKSMLLEALGNPNSGAGSLGYYVAGRGWRDHL